MVTHPAEKTLCVLVHRPVVRELQFVLKDSDIYIGVVVRPEWCLPHEIPTHI